MEQIVTAEQLDRLRETVRSRFTSEYRWRHTLGVEQMAIRLGRLYAPDKLPLLQAAALLHDVTKEISFEKQLKICEDAGIIVTSEQKASPATLHAVTAAAILPTEFPAFAVPEVISAVRYHTTGRAGMTITDKILYLADAIEENRTYDAYVALRQSFWDAHPEEMSPAEARRHLDLTVLCALETTMAFLTREGSVIEENTRRAAQDLKERITRTDVV